VTGLISPANPRTNPTNPNPNTTNPEKRTLTTNCNRDPNRTDRNPKHCCVCASLLSKNNR